MKIEHYCEPKSKIVNQLGQAVLLESNGRHFLIEEATQDLAQAEEWESMLAPGIVVTKPEGIREFSWL